MNDIITDALKKHSAGLLNKAYDDMVHPAAEAIGAMISIRLGACTFYAESTKSG